MMHRPNFLARPRSLIRAFLLFVVLLGGQFSLLAGLTGLTRVQAAVHPTGLIKPVSKPSGVAALKPTHNNVATKTHRTHAGPDLKLQALAGAASYHVGNTLTLTFTVDNEIGADLVLSGVPVTVTSALPAGLTNVKAPTTNSNVWNITVSSATSPSLVKATYVGSYPIAAGTVLPAITVTGMVTNKLVGLFSDSASAAVSGDSSLGNNTANVSVNIQPDAASAAAPYLTVNEATSSGITNAAVGDTVTFNLLVTNTNAAGNENSANSITISDVIPTGLTNVSVNGQNWTIDAPAPGQVGPTLVTATYTGTYPVAPGQTLTPFSITGTLTAAALPLLTNTVIVNSPDNTDLLNNFAVFT